jgi:hypothetical protein
MFRKKNAVNLQTAIIDMLKKKPLEMYRTDKLLAMYAPGIDRVIIVTGRNSHMSEGDCLKQLVLATRENHSRL